MWIRWNNGVMYHLQGDCKIFTSTTNGGLMCVSICSSLRSTTDVVSFRTNHPDLLMDKIWQAIQANCDVVSISEDELKKEYDRTAKDYSGIADMDGMGVGG